MFPEVILFSPASYLFERNWSLILFVSLSRYHTYYLTGLVLIYNQLGLTCYAYVRYRLFCFVFVTSNEVQNILVLYLWRRNSNEELWNQEMQRVIKDWSIEQMTTRGFDQSEDADRQNKNNVTERNRSQKSPSLGDPRSGSNAIYSRRNLVCCEQKQAADRAETDRWMVWLSTDSRYSKAAVTLYQKGILVQRKRVPCRWAVSFPDENVFTTDGKGICRSSWRKSMRCPRRLRVPSLNKIAQTVVRPSSLYGNFAQRIVSGI